MNTIRVDLQYILQFNSIVLKHHANIETEKMISRQNQMFFQPVQMNNGESNESR